jgi:CRP-like cAMP-binding protein
MSHADSLARVPLFQGCTPDELAQIAELAVEQTFVPGQIIVTQGTPGTAFYILLAGRVEMTRDGRSLGLFSAGDFFGEMSLLDNAPRSATVKAVDETTCIMLSCWDFRSLLERQPSIALKLLEVLSRRLRAANDRLSG